MSQTAQYFIRAGQPIICRATALGGPLAVLRVSGSGLKCRFSELFSTTLEPRKVHYSKVAGADNSVVLFFEGPNSFTGEDVIEIQAHGVPSLLDTIEKSFIEHGAQKALPGEFSFRAVLNNKMTLSEAEALNAALSDNSLNAEWAKELVGVSKVAQQKSATLVAEAISSISKARGRVEASIDYPEAEAEQQEEVDAAVKVLTSAKHSLQSLLTSVENFTKGSQEESTLLILGEPNVGKSTLLNILSGGERSLVSSEAGTTRDYIDAKFRGPDGEKIRLIDTAGLRFGSEVGAVESAGVNRALDLIDEADGVIILTKATQVLASLPDGLLSKLEESKLPVLRLCSHADKASSPNVGAFDFISKPKQVSAFIFKWLSKKELFNSRQEKSFSNEYWVSIRQAVFVEDAIQHINEAMLSLNEQRPLELCGDSLTASEKSLRAVLGEGLSDEYIGEIFSQFCLGK